MGYICTRCGGTNVACEAIVNPNTGKIIDYFDGSFMHAICSNCENEVIISNIEEVKHEIDLRFHEFVERTGKEPEYVECQIVRKETGDEQRKTMKLSLSINVGEDLEQADRALINKVYHMLFDIGSDFESVIRMLYSFRNGPKSGIKVADPEDNYEWTNKDGNEKYSTKNLPKAHFRWDWGRYTLSKESVDKITEFVDTILKS